MVDVWQLPKYTSIYEWLLNIFCILEFGSINMSRQVRSCRKIIRDDENRAFVLKSIGHTRKNGMRTLERTQGPRILRRTLSLKTLKRTLSLMTLEKTYQLMRTLKRTLSMRTLKRTL